MLAGLTACFFSCTLNYGIILLEEDDEDQLTRPEMWALYFKYVDDTKKRDKINRIIAKEEGLAMASSMLQKLAQDDAARTAILSIEKAQLDQDNLIYQAEKRGELKGELKNAIKTVKAMAEHGDELSYISTITKLPLEKIEEILKQG